MSKRHPLLTFLLGFGGPCLLSLLILLSVTTRASGSETTKEVRVIAMATTRTRSPAAADGASNEDNRIRMVFSDVDGTLVHYPTEEPTKLDDNDDISSNNCNSNHLIHLPPSATGMRGILSARTLLLCRSLQTIHGTSVVLVSGMRTSTLWKRIPFLPRADAYCSEAGGRIFYPTTTRDDGHVQFQPVHFTGSNNREQDLIPFGLVEDLEWRARMEATSAAGSDGFVGNEMLSSSSDTTGKEETHVPLSERHGELWKFARELESRGLILDYKGYSTCFRVNQKHQSSPELFQTMLRDISIPETLASSTNLGCVDFYPRSSGKKNCCDYVLQRLCGASASLNQNAICLCDDDNDLEMAMACRHAFLPGITSQSMAEVVRQNPQQFTIAAAAPTTTTTMDDSSSGDIQVMEGTPRTTERALEMVLETISSKAL